MEDSLAQSTTYEWLPPWIKGACSHYHVVYGTRLGMAVLPLHSGWYARRSLECQRCDIDNRAVLPKAHDGDRNTKQTRVEDPCSCRYSRMSNCSSCCQDSGNGGDPYHRCKLIQICSQTRPALTPTAEASFGTCKPLMKVRAMSRDQFPELSHQEVACLTRE
jgi:hypothetical protein